MIRYSCARFSFAGKAIEDKEKRLLYFFLNLTVFTYMIYIYLMYLCYTFSFSLELFTHIYIFSSSFPTLLDRGIRTKFIQNEIRY